MTIKTKKHKKNRNYNDLTEIGLTPAAIEAAYSSEEALIGPITRAAIALNETDRFRALLIIRTLALASDKADTQAIAQAA